MFTELRREINSLVTRVQVVVDFITALAGLAKGINGASGLTTRCVEMPFLLVLFGSFRYQHSLEVIELAAKVDYLLLVVKFYPYLLAFVFRHGW